MSRGATVTQWSFRCGGGHDHGPFRSEAEARKVAREMNREPWHSECWPCPADGAGFESYDVRDPSEQVLVKPHFTPHMNVCLGRYVESREHFEHLKEKTGTTEVVLKRRKRGSLPAIAEAAHSRQTAEVRGVSIPDPETVPKEVLEEDEGFEEHTVIEEDADA